MKPTVIEDENARKELVEWNWNYDEIPELNKVLSHVSINAANIVFNEIKEDLELNIYLRDGDNPEIGIILIYDYGVYFDLFKSLEDAIDEHAYAIPMHDDDINAWSKLSTGLRLLADRAENLASQHRQNKGIFPPAT